MLTSRPYELLSGEAEPRPGEAAGRVAELSPYFRRDRRRGQRIYPHRRVNPPRKKIPTSHVGNYYQPIGGVRRFGIERPQLFATSGGSDICYYRHADLVAADHEQRRHQRSLRRDHREPINAADGCRPTGPPGNSLPEFVKCHYHC